MHRLGNLFPGSFQHFSHRGTKKGLMVPVRASETFRAPCASGKSRIDAPPPPRVLLKQACRSCCKNASCGKNAPFFFPIPNFFPKPHVDDILMGTGTIVHYLTKTHTHTHQFLHKPIFTSTSFYVFLHKHLFLHQTLFAETHSCTNHFLHKPALTQMCFSTNHLLHQPALTQTRNYTHKHTSLYANQFFDQPIFRQTTFCTNQHLQTSFDTNQFYTNQFLHKSSFKRHLSRKPPFTPTNF